MLEIEWNKKNQTGQIRYLTRVILIINQTTKISNKIQFKITKTLTTTKYKDGQFKNFFKKWCLKIQIFQKNASCNHRSSSSNNGGGG